MKSFQYQKVKKSSFHTRTYGGRRGGRGGFVQEGHSDGVDITSVRKEGDG